MEETLFPIGFGIAASLATLLGGSLALGFQRRITIILGLAAGVVLGVALFDLIPESLEMARGIYAPTTMLFFVAIGLGAYLTLTRVLGTAGLRMSVWRNHLGPASLTLHSFLDGVGIGLAFHISSEIGWTVALAVLTHDIADGINTVSLSLATTEPATARRWLYANGVAPLVGVVAGLVIHVPEYLLAPLLAMFGGAFLFIGACELIPRSHALDPRLRITGAVLMGMVLMMLVTQASR